MPRRPPVASWSGPTAPICWSVTEGTVTGTLPPDGGEVTVATVDIRVPGIAGGIQHAKLDAAYFAQLAPGNTSTTGDVVVYARLTGTDGQRTPAMRSTLVAFTRAPGGIVGVFDVPTGTDATVELVARTVGMSGTVTIAGTGTVTTFPLSADAEP